MGTSRLEDVDWGRVIERLCYLFPPVIGVGLVGVLQEADLGVPGLQWGLVLFGTFGYTVLTLGLTTALFLDARRVQVVGGWHPRPWLNALFAFVLAPVAGVVYLYRRHERFGTPATRSEWWIVIAISLGTTVAGLGTAVIAYVLAMPGLVATAIGLAGTVAFGAFPIAIHQDAAYVCTRRSRWNPNPGTYLGFAFLSLFVPPLQPLLAAYYLFQRRRAVGLRES
ncbi:hypothetical protein [Natronoglomus mannanivorans]|uniref:Uncharacterized protein n=1 Tax=Natronoglomus mannanivorans TaxID=2979990 RepID=A0AAP2YXC2_9EURY|nr:hypothetical protein [Halobacteria archaeon AArc-xg1-1]